MEGETAGEAARLLRGSGLHLSLPYITQELVIGSIRCKALPFSFFHVAQSHRFIQPLYCRCYHCLSPRVLTTVGEKSWIGTSVKKKKEKRKDWKEKYKTLATVISTKKQLRQFTTAVVTHERH